MSLTLTPGSSEASAFGESPDSVAALAQGVFTSSNGIFTPSHPCARHHICFALRRHVPSLFRTPAQGKNRSILPLNLGYSKYYSYICMIYHSLIAFIKHYN